MVLQLSGVFMTNREFQGYATLTLIGTLLLLVALGFYTVVKGKSPLWCLAGCGSNPCLILLGVLKNVHGERASEHHRDSLEDQLAEKQNIIDEFQSNDSWAAARSMGLECLRIYGPVSQRG